MTITWITAIGLVAAVCTTISFLPQVIKTWRTKSAGDLSLIMYAVLCTGVLLWGIYGIAIGDLPIILGNAITLALAGSILYFIIKDRPTRGGHEERNSQTSSDDHNGDAQLLFAIHGTQAPEPYRAIPPRDRIGLPN